MGISPQLFDVHRAALSQAHRSNYKAAWIDHLFRHENVHNALEILKTGAILSRAQATNSEDRFVDIAPEEIINNRADAHRFARLYFRPKTPTQYHVEGVKRRDDYYYGVHGGVIVMLVFDARAVLTDPATQFSDGNMQSPDTQLLTGDDAFASLDFSKIYHDESVSEHPEKTDVIRHRCAEVLAPDRLEIDQRLKAIVVRTSADFKMMKHLLAENGLERYASLLRIASAGTFFNANTAVSFVDSGYEKQFFMGLRPFRSGGPARVHLDICDMTSKDPVATIKAAFPTVIRHRIEFNDQTAKRYLLRVYLEECFAHESVIAFK